MLGHANSKQTAKEVTGRILRKNVAVSVACVKCTPLQYAIDDVLDHMTGK